MCASWLIAYAKHERAKVRQKKIPPPFLNIFNICKHKIGLFLTHTSLQIRIWGLKMCTKGLRGRGAEIEAQSFGANLVFIVLIVPIVLIVA